MNAIQREMNELKEGEVRAVLQELLQVIGHAAHQGDEERKTLAQQGMHLGRLPLRSGTACTVREVTRLNPENEHVEQRAAAAASLSFVEGVPII
ncbi:hypothetical protein [Paenibacillus humicola]|uniref:hypothetical protein n=1 Tax=Paenibacillus humicola TaxID=3110540 RepID=UPI00237B5B0E|nr:hypothetical protein [Paenibacillus humicola]